MKTSIDNNQLAKKPVKVGQVVFSPMIGGSEIVAANICKHLHAPDFDPVVLFLYDHPGPMKKILADSDISYDCFKLSKWKRFIRPLLIAHLLNKLEIDILHVHHLNFYLHIQPALRFSKVKGVLFTEHSYRQLKNNPKRQGLLKKAISEVGLFTVISHKMKKDLAQYAPDPDSIQVIYNGVDTHRFSPTRACSRPQIVPQDSKVIVKVGRLVEEKDHQTLFAAFKNVSTKIPDVSLILVGDGPLKDELKKLAEDLGILPQIQFAGTQSDIVPFLKHADLFVLSSQSEGLPMVILEAMASELPIISTDVGGISELIINRKTGLTVPPKSTEALTHSIIQLLTQRDFAKELASNARKTVLEHYSQEAITRQYMDKYLEILNS